MTERIIADYWKVSAGSTSCVCVSGEGVCMCICMSWCVCIGVCSARVSKHMCVCVCVCVQEHAGEGEGRVYMFPCRYKCTYIYTCVHVLFGYINVNFAGKAQLCICTCYACRSLCHSMVATLFVHIVVRD